MRKLLKFQVELEAGTVDDAITAGTSSATLACNAAGTQWAYAGSRITRAQCTYDPRELVAWEVDASQHAAEAAKQIKVDRNRKWAKVNDLLEDWCVGHSVAARKC